jgi:uncharacterized protein (TIGR00369 family)
MPENKMNQEQLQQRLMRAPFHRWLGLEVTGVDEDGIDIRIPWRDEFFVNKEAGYAHGGILATVIDMAADYALAAKLGRPFPTVDMRVDYHRAAKAGDMTVRASVVKLGKIFSVGEASVYDADGNLLASGRAVYAVAAPK